MPTQADLDRLPAEVRMELRNQQRAERHQWLNSLGILFGVLFTAGSLVATGLALRTAQEDLRTSQENVRIAREGQLTDRYAKTLEALADDDTTIRLGAIHALNRLLADSPRDRATITAVLAGFIRDRDPAPTTKDKDLPFEPSVDPPSTLRRHRRRTHHPGQQPPPRPAPRPTRHPHPLQPPRQRPLQQSRPRRRGPARRGPEQRGPARRALSVGVDEIRRVAVLAEHDPGRRHTPQPLTAVR